MTLEREDSEADVLVVTNGWPNEDIPTYCVFIRRQMESLGALGLRFDVLFIRGYRSPLAYALAAVRLAYWSLTQRRRYRLVHAHGGETAPAAACYFGAPLLVSYLGDDLLGTPRADGSVPLHGRVRRAVIRQLSRLADHTITKSRDMQAALPERVRRRNTVLPNGVDTELFRPISRATARANLGFKEMDRIVLFAADPEIPRKRYWLAQRVVDRARTFLPTVRLVVAQGMNPDAVPEIMNAADCLLLTSSIEGSPNVVKEALMCNLPVVATPAGDALELLDGVVPSYVRALEADLAEALVECLRTPMRSNGRQVSAHLDSTVVAHSLLKLYQRLASSIRVEEGTLDPA